MFRYGWVLKDKDFIKSVLVIAIPMMVQQLLTTSVNLLDNLMVGQLGDVAIAAVATSNKFLSIGIFGMIAVVNAAIIFLAQFYGANQPEGMRQSLRYGLVSSILVVLPLVFLGVFFPQLVIGFFKNDPQLIEQATLYLPLAALTLIPQVISFCLQYSMRAIGNTRHPLYGAIISLCLNGSLNYLLIFGHFGFPQLGLVGAALGTMIARLAELAYLVIVYVRSDFPFKTSIFDLFKIDKHLAKSITLKGVPLVINDVLWAMGMAVLYKLYGTRGLEVMSAYTIQQTLGDLYYILFQGMATATTILVAHPLGANQLDKARKHGYQLLQFAVMMSMVFAGMMFMTSYLIPLLYQVSPKVSTLAQNIMRISSCFFWIYMFNSQSYYIIRAGGDIMSTLKMDALYMWCVNLVVVFCLAHFTPISIYLLFALGQSTDIIKVMIAYHFVKKEKWVVNLTHKEDLIEDFIN